MTHKTLKLSAKFKSQILFGNINCTMENFPRLMAESMMEAKNDFFEVICYLLENPLMYDDPLIFVASNYY